MQFKKGQNYSIIVIPVILLIVVTATAISLNAEGQENDPVVFKVDEEPIMAEELRLWMHEHRHDTIKYFLDNYQVKKSKDFWNTDYHGEKPMEVNKSKALNALIKMKVELALAKEYGVQTYRNYKNFRQLLKVENKRREEFLKQGKPIYGLKQYDPFTYLTYLHSNMLIQLKDILKEKILSVSEAEAFEIYQSRAESFKQPDTIKATIYSSKFTNREGQVDLSLKQNAKEALLELKRRLQTSEKPPGDMSINLSNKSGVNVEASTKLFHKNHRRRDQLQYPQVMRVVEKMEKGQWSDLIELNNQYVLLNVTEIKKGLKQPFEEVKALIINREVDLRFHELIEQRIREVKLVEYEALEKVHFGS